MRISSQEQNPTAIATSFPSPPIDGIYHDSIVHALNDRRIVLEAALGELVSQTSVLTDIATRLVETLQNGHKVLVVGNGGRAA